MSTTQFSVTLCKWVERERDFPEIFESIVTIYFVATMYLSDDRIFGMRREVIRCIYDNLYARQGDKFLCQLQETKSLIY